MSVCSELDRAVRRMTSVSCGWRLFTEIHVDEKRVSSLMRKNIAGQCSWRWCCCERFCQLSMIDDELFSISRHCITAYLTQYTHSYRPSNYTHTYTHTAHWRAACCWLRPLPTLLEDEDMHFRLIQTEIRTKPNIRTVKHARLCFCCTELMQVLSRQPDSGSLWWWGRWWWNDIS